MLTELVALMEMPLDYLTVGPVFFLFDVCRHIFEEVECSGLWLRCLIWKYVCGR